MKARKTSSAEADQLQELQELANRNGRMILPTGRTDQHGDAVMTTCDYPHGEDAKTGTVSELIRWERGYKKI